MFVVFLFRMVKINWLRLMDRYCFEMFLPYSWQKRKHYSPKPRPGGTSCAGSGLTTADFQGVCCSQLCLTPQPEQQDTPQEEERTIQKTKKYKRLSSSGTPLANVQSQKIKWTKCVLCWPRSRKSDMLDSFPSARRQSCSAGVQEHLGGVRNSPTRSYDTGSVASFCLNLRKKVTESGLHPQVNNFLFFSRYRLCTSGCDR